jgi:hypothetical protein
VLEIDTHHEGLTLAAAAAAAAAAVAVAVAAAVAQAVGKKAHNVPRVVVVEPDEVHRAAVERGQSSVVLSVGEASEPSQEVHRAKAVDAARLGGGELGELGREALSHRTQIDGPLHAPEGLGKLLMAPTKLRAARARSTATAATLSDEAKVILVHGLERLARGMVRVVVVLDLHARAAAGEPTLCCGDDVADTVFDAVAVTVTDPLSVI